MPWPGLAVSLAITVRLRLPWRTSSSITRSGLPTAMKPPIITLAPSGMRATASFTETVFMAGHPSGYAPPVRSLCMVPQRPGSDIDVDQPMSSRVLTCAQGAHCDGRPEPPRRLLQSGRKQGGNPVRLQDCLAQPGELPLVARCRGQAGACRVAGVRRPDAPVLEQID